VEEQRVNVIIDLIEPRTRWARLGHGYRVTVAIRIWQAEDRLLVPVSALFRDGGQWTVYVVGADGRAEARRVEIGQLNDEVAEVRAGLRQGEQVILHPGDRVAAGVRVRAGG
jgi:HlyD family secretion protein